ncbi:MAG: amino acid ABC transporter permease [Clostridiaceae bacterium]|nr:amino acid ABC transporter permease [Eubacteriales bacterium]
MSIFEQFNYISSGMGITFSLVPCVMLATILLGSIIGTIQYYRVPILSHILDLYILVMRGIPPLVVIMLLYYSINMSSSFMAAFACLTTYHSAYIAEIVRGGFAAIPKGQMQAGESLGLGYVSIMVRIYIPQVALHIVPSLCGQLILVIKDSTLVSAVGLEDIMWASRQLVTITFQPMTAYLIIFILYYVICLLIELLAHRVERALSRSSLNMNFRGVQQ